MFDYCELEFNEDFLPQAHHKLHLGIADRYKWYPVKRDVNEKYLSNIPRWAIEIVDEECGELAKKFNYTPEGP